MGRPLGLPHDRKRQLAVIRAALQILETADHAPLVEHFVPVTTTPPISPDQFLVLQSQLHCETVPEAHCYLGELLSMTEPEKLSYNKWSRLSGTVVLGPEREG
jgi:hypothetical protein